VAKPSIPERDLGRYLALAQTGLEMVAPIVAGVYLDKYFGWSPWATAVGAILGLVGGMAHLVIMARRQDQPQQTDSPKEPN
jgi:F0F1-type ATP synthase assembly protein I